MKIKNKKSN